VTVFIRMCINQPEIKVIIRWSFYEEEEPVFNQFQMNHMEIVLGDLNAIVGTHDIFKPTARKESLPEINDNGLRVVNFTT